MQYATLKQQQTSLPSRAGAGGRQLHSRWLSWLCGLTLLGNLGPAQALVFNVTYDASTANAPAEFAASFANVLRSYQAMYSDPITINLQVGWGEINGRALSAGNLGQSQTNQQAVSYAALKTAMSQDSKSAADALAVSSLPLADPTPGVKFALSNAEAKALGLLAGNSVAIDGYVGFLSSASYFFDPNLGAKAGQYDFFALANHEVTEVMGRYGFGQNGGGGRDSPIDLFRYLAASGQRDLTPSRGTANYFSIDGGATALNSFNIAASGDLSDWAGTTLDAYNASLSKGKVLPVSAGDLTLLDVLGYDRVAAVPESSTAAMMLCGLAGLVIRRRWRGPVY